MTSLVTETNQIISQLKVQYQKRISQLELKITEQQKEITQLQEQIKLLSHIKEYDC